MNSLGTAPVLSPKKSLICVEAIRMAMPLVKPTTTMRGMYRTAEPNPVTPIRTRKMPAMKVTSASPLMPKRAKMPATITTKAPVGPPICVREPPKAEITKPATTAVYRPACGVTPEAMPKAIASGKATRPTVTPARRSDQKF